MELVLFIFIILVASILQTSSGFGFSILATPFLLLLFEPFEAIQINLLVSLIISMLLFRKINSDIDYGMLRRLVIGSLPGLPLGIYIFLTVDISLLKVGVSIIILCLTLLLLFSFRIKQKQSRDYGVGSITGTLTTAIGMPGPPLLLYFLSTNTSKATVRATTLAFYLFIYFVSFVIQMIFAGTSQVVWTSTVISLPFVLGGLWVGQYLYRKMDQRTFRILTYILLFFTAIYLLVERFI
ncbi:sulfite exporter TauE/SafE family protein [Alkalihalobacillus sp. 1P02AB]|uniref:sulfite exporter TauE/SafE family protein n=1 Tax=Alkalihalobacillus sp. 1P02AB TaxID=3132260 RepID=UPI0039A751DE